MIGAISAAAVGVVPDLGRVAGGLVGAPVRALARGGAVLDVAAASAFHDGVFGSADGAFGVEDCCHCCWRLEMVSWNGGGGEMILIRGSMRLC